MNRSQSRKRPLCITRSLSEDSTRKGRHLRSKELREVASSVRNGTFTYEARPKKSVDWATYDEAQINELADMLNSIRDIVDEACARIAERPPEVKTGPGRPQVPACDLAKALMLQSYFGAGNRVAAGLVRVFGEKLHISSEFSYKTIERGYDPGRVTPILEEVLRITNEMGNGNENTFAADGSGDPSTVKVNYESRRSEQRKERKEESGRELSLFPDSTVRKHDFQYLALTAGVHTKVISAFTSTDDHSIGELSHFPSLMDTTALNCPSMDTMLGDGLYAARTVCAVTEQYGVMPYFLPKSNSTFRSHGVPSWSHMTHALVLDPQQWLSVYHMRSNAETVMSMLKRRLPAKIRKKLPERKKTEEFLKADVHNVRQCCYLTYTHPEMLKGTEQ